MSVTPLPPFVGSYGYLGYAPETAFGTPVTATGFVPFIDCDIKKEPGLVEIKAARGQRELSAYLAPGEQKISGKISFPLFPAMGIDIVAAAIGALATGGASITQQNALVSLTLEVGLGGLASIQYAGVLVNKMTIKGSTKSEAQVSCDIVAQTDLVMTTPTTQSYGDDLPFTLAGTSVKLLGGATGDSDVESFEFTVDNMVDQIFTYSSKRYPTYLPSKGRKITLKVSKALSSLDYYNALPAADASSLTAEVAQAVILANGAKAMTFAFPQMSIINMSQPMKVGATIMQDIELQAWLGALDATMSATIA